MKVLSILLLSFSVVQADTTAKLIPSLIQVESKGDSKAVGDNGKALGALQIWKVVVQDVNSIHKTKYTHKDMFDLQKSKTVCYKYLNYHGKQYKQRYNKPASYEVLSRIWNGGPTGYKKQTTNNYWLKVKADLKKRKLL
jgi:hypothetical protein